jgi:hypothetical protein
MAVNVKPGIRLGPTNKIRYCEKFKYLISINKIIPTDYLTIMELMSFGKSKGGNYRGQNGNDDLAMTCVNLSPFFESSQYWDLATLTYELMSVEYRKEVEEKIFSFFRSGNAKPLYDYDSLRGMNSTSNKSEDDRTLRRNVFDMDALEKMKNILLMVTMLLMFGFTNAQCKIYSGKYANSSQQVGLFENGKIYSGKYANSSQQVGLVEGGGMTCGAAAAFLLLL